MQRLAFPISKSLDQFKSLYGSASATAKPQSLSSRSSSDSISSGSLANLKLTAEKLVKEQASVKTDLEIANAKLKKSTEQVHALEEKLQNAFNENAKLKVKHKEDEKLWKGLESKFSSTKTLCDQLTETLQQLASVVQEAERDKETLETKLSASSKALDSLNKQMEGLSLKLDSAEETIRTRDNELEKLKSMAEEREKFLRDEQSRTANLIQEKDTTIKKLEELFTASKLDTESLNAKLGEALAAHVINVESESSNLSSKFDELNSLYACGFELVQQERDIFAKHTQKQYCDLNDKFLAVALEKDAIQIINHELSRKVKELQKVLESTVAQHTEESLLASERIKTLEADAETLNSKREESEVLISKLEEKARVLLENSKSSENQTQGLLLKISALETESKEITERLQEEIMKKSEEIDTLQKERTKLEQNADSLHEEVSQLHSILEDKEQHILQYKEKEKKLEDQITENQSLLTASESKLSEARKQYDQMVESKQLELSRHLKEISLRNDQAINDIRKKYELEKMEIVNKEKEKVDKAIAEIERKCDQKLVECKEESMQQLTSIREEHAALLTKIQQEHDKKQVAMIAEHNEQLKRTQQEAENELREKMMFLRSEHEAEMKALRCDLEDECQKLEEELHLQKTKEDRQRALLQLQWKVMSVKPKEDQEVNSKQDYSITSIKRRNSCGGQRNQHDIGSPYYEATQTPVPKLMKKVENVKTGSALSIPKHHRKVTRHEYEVETSNGRTITKKRKTRSTVMFENTKVEGHPRPSNIGDLFSEGSLNPYADDPYAFD
ncbi:hypothetical protein PIB30_074726 [Stylosanthes scabra]|uniref:Synaptonemal complex protein 1 n=1 Tax=Stylosanthes scabra TaxID=79078 RepID=A0ABU6WRC5_9FABA|nr:hypothetical protein [Stylosanthes scabra]